MEKGKVSGIREKELEESGRPKVRDVVNLALEAGRILLKNGGEIFRVEETITRICNYYGVEKMDIFTLSHGIFISAESEGKETYARVKHIPLSGANLAVVAEVNALSRDIVAGKYSVEEASARLKEIEQVPETSWIFRTFCAAIGSACFGALMGANLTECTATVLIGALVYEWTVFAQKHRISKIIINIVGGMIITAMAALIKDTTHIITLHLNVMIIGGIMPLIPGLAFVNAIRDIADSDFLSGTVRMIDAILVFVYIAVGVGVVLGIHSNMMGGMNL